MISVQDRLFCLSNEVLTCILRACPDGQLEQVYFGTPVAVQDAEALALKTGTGWGDAICYQEGCPPSSLDIRPLVCSGAGRGDFRDPGIELFTDKGLIPFDFQYDDYRIVRGTIPMNSSLPAASGDAETLIISLHHASLPLTCELCFSVFETALTRRSVIINGDDTAVYITRIMSQMWDLPGSFEMTTLNGAWAAEAHMSRVAVGRTRTVNESTVGFSSARHNPGVLLSRPGACEDSGLVFSFNLVYSGNHYTSAQRTHQNLTRLVSGISPEGFRQEIAPGESFESPEAVATLSGNGFNGARANMHSFINSHIVPEAWRYRVRPVLFNDWEGCMFDFTESKLLSLAKQAKSLGCELFVLDDGWFGARSNDKAGLGDYSVNLKKIPSGLDGLARKIRKLGMNFGLWFEPEAVNPDSDLYRAHPDWAIHQEGLPDLYQRHEMLLDLRRPEVRDYIVESVGSVLDSAEISYVKWDMNRFSPLTGADAHAYILGLYDVLRRIFTPRPEILLEGCSSGGNRFDLGILSFAPQIWASDDTDPVERLDIQSGLSLLYPLSTIGSHVSASPNAQTLRATPLATRGNVAFFGILGYELDLANLTPAEKDEIHSQIEFYIRYRKLFQFGTFRRLPADAEEERWQVSLDTVSASGLFHRLIHAGPGYEWLRADGLDADRRYTAAGREQLLRVGQFGELVKHISPVAIRPNGPAMRAADRNYRMKDGTQSFNCSGVALAAGIPLSQLYCGAGYDASMRTQGDFGSNVYIISEEEIRDE